MGYRSTIQIALIIISIVIITTYIKPAFQDMQDTQAETKEFQNALEMASSFNSELQRLLDTANSFSTSERRDLERYLPDTVDTIAVMRDIETIVAKNNMILNSVSSEAIVNKMAGRVVEVQNIEGVTQSGDSDVAINQFNIGITGTYEQFKLLLQDFERNAYPLEAASVSFTPSEDLLYIFNLTLETYSLSEVSE